MDRTLPRKSISTSSALRRPIFRPMKKAPSGIERHRDRGLADLAAHRLLAQQQAFLLELAHDDRDGLRRQPGHARDVGFGQAAVLAHQRQHEPLIVVAHAALVGAAVECGSRLPRANRASQCRFPLQLLPSFPLDAFWAQNGVNDATCCQ